MAINISCLTVGAWKENAYLIKNGSICYLVDPGDEFTNIDSTFQVAKLDALGIINTHGHFDHVGAVSQFKERYKIPFYLHSKDKSILRQANLYKRLAGGQETFQTPTIDFYLDDNIELAFGDLTIKAHHTPGHTQGSVSFEVEKNLFSGDLIFTDSVGRTDLPGGNKKVIEQSLNYLFDLFLGYTIYPGHESPFLLDATKVDELKKAIMIDICIKAIEFHLPENRITNSDLQQIHPEWDLQKVGEKSGVLQRHIAAKDVTACDLAIGAVKKIFESKIIDQDEIGGIIFCTQSPDHIMPSNAFLVHKFFNFKSAVWAFDYNLACSGYIYGLSICRGMIITGMADNILLITGDTYSKYINPGDRSTSVLFGDGASVSLISKTTDKHLYDLNLASSGKEYDTFIIPAGGSRLPLSASTKEPIIDFSGNTTTQENIKMNGFAVWKFIAATVPKQILQMLERNNLTIDDIDFFGFHQASKLTLDSLFKSLKIPANKAYTNLQNIGNTVSSSIPIALKQAQDEGKLKKGDLMLLSGFGVGLSWGSAIIKY